MGDAAEDLIEMNDRGRDEPDETCNICGGYYYAPPYSALIACNCIGHKIKME